MTAGVQLVGRFRSKRSNSQVSQMAIPSIVESSIHKHTSIQLIPTSGPRQTFMGAPTCHLFEQS